jgi:hypothetical protein
MIPVYAGPAQFDDLIPPGLEGREIEFLFAVVAQASRCCGACLKAIGSDHRTRLGVLDQEVIANGIEGIRIQSSGVGGFQAFVQLQVEDGVPQALGRLHLGLRIRESEKVGGCGAGEQVDHGDA